jgi:hypothetical protein
MTVLLSSIGKTEGGTDTLAAQVNTTINHNFFVQIGPRSAHQVEIMFGLGQAYSQQFLWRNVIA